eukprot:GHVS01059007.1.p1 GENE.GHVS01059007.1~~GHVS01059007.1.p1  ORF type:complete len:606 (+),score=86.57 GHVS01059007.1:58-1875(+)
MLINFNSSSRNRFYHYYYQHIQWSCCYLVLSLLWNTSTTTLLVFSPSPPHVFTSYNCHSSLSLFSAASSCLPSNVNSLISSSPPPPLIAITGGQVVSADALCGADLLIVGEKVVLVCPPSADLSATILSIADHSHPNVRVIRADGKLVMPGGIDPHTHLDMPFMGTVSCDDFDTGHQAALAGGTTMHIDFALPVDGSLVKGLEVWKSKATGKARIDYSFHMAITEWNDKIKNEMEVMVREGVTSFKFFLAYKGSLMVTDQQLINGMRAAKALGALVLVHAENGDAVATWQQYVAEELNIRGPEGHALSRPAYLEAEATNRAITLAQLVNCPLYVVHVMSAQSLEAVRRAKAAGARVFGEATIAGIALDESAMWSRDYRWAAAHVMSPPIRQHCIDGVALQEAITEGIISCLGTDHAVFSSAQKLLGASDFRRIPNGVNGIEERINVGFELIGTPEGIEREKDKCESWWTRRGEGERRKLSSAALGLVQEEEGQCGGRDRMWRASRRVMQFVSVTSTEVAKIFNLYPQKGIIAPGSDADLYLFDPNSGPHTISATKHHSKVDTNVFEGFRLAGSVVMTMSRGEVVWEEGQIKAKKGRQLCPSWSLQ